METKLARIAEIAKAKPKERFTALAHLLNKQMLMDSHLKLPADKATGVDKVTKAVYGEQLEGNLDDLIARMKRNAYKPQASRRTYIPKDEKSMRPLGIPSYEDKIVQHGINQILQAIYEQDFMGYSFGFRPGRSQHDAIRALDRIIMKEPIRYVVDADIRGFFNHMDHEWMMKFLAHRIADPNLLRLIKKFLKAGIQEDGEFKRTDEGAPQGGIVSPILSNIYLHYALDLWFEMTVKRECVGRAEMVRYADDFVCCFEQEKDAKRFYEALVVRLKTFGLEIAEEKTKIIRFGRQSEVASKEVGLKKPETFRLPRVYSLLGQREKWALKTH
ncbi:group II intron reverse transcriptase/maturase, partial [Paenibacillus alba]